MATNGERMLEALAREAKADIMRRRFYIVATAIAVVALVVIAIKL